MWKLEHRRAADRNDLRYPSDLTDAEWAIVEPLIPPVCTENSVRIDYVTESHNVSDDDRSVLPLPGPVRLAVQVEEPT
jgi:hypothetical protein